MTYQDAVRHFNGNASELARALGLGVRSVYNWRIRGRIPPLQQYRLEELTQGQLRRDSPAPSR
jgi:hypothetical protein